jgi:hypothetical protein
MVKTCLRVRRQNSHRDTKVTCDERQAGLPMGWPRFEPYINLKRYCSNFSEGMWNVNEVVKSEDEE